MKNPAIADEALLGWHLRGIYVTGDNDSSIEQRSP